MQWRYTKFDERFRQLMAEQQLKKLFLELLMQTGGNVDEALEWMKQLGEHYGLFPEGTSIDDIREMLQDEGYISADMERRPGERRGRKTMGYKPTRKAEKAIRSDAFHELFAKMRQDQAGGDHVTPYSGAGGDRLPETRPYEFGDRAQDINCVNSISNAMRNHGWNLGDITEEDLEVHEVENTTSCATVLALDISHSMTLYGEDRITPAKKVALALTEMIQTRFKKDALDVILFGDDAMAVDPRELPFVTNGPYHTNTKAALELGQLILARKKHQNKQIVMITDGKPSAIFEGKQLYINSFGLDAKIVNKTIEEATACRRKNIVITTFMITSDPYLKQFVERLSKANKGRAYYADLNNLGSFVMMDYVRNRMKEL